MRTINWILCRGEMKSKSAFGSIFLIAGLVVLTACSSNPQSYVPGGQPTAIVESTLTVPSSNTNNSDEEQIRYILADAQLGGVIDYYRQYLDQPNIAEAVCRWDEGVRVQNINDFERKIVDSWMVVYVATETKINGTDVALTSNQTCSGGNPETAGTCANAYWPLKDGSYWDYVYYYNNQVASNQVYRSRLEVDSSKTPAYKYYALGGSWNFYPCIEGNIYGDGWYLPSEKYIHQETINFDSIADFSYQGTETIEFKVKNVPAGGFEVVELCADYGTGYRDCVSFAKGIGLVTQEHFGDDGVTYSYLLKDYLVP